MLQSMVDMRPVRHESCFECRLTNSNTIISQGLEKMWEHSAFEKYKLSSSEWELLLAILEVLIPFKKLTSSMVTESTPTLSFVIPCMNLLINKLENIKEQGRGLLHPDNVTLSCSIHTHMGTAAEFALAKIAKYYNKLAKVPAFHIATSKSLYYI